MKKKKKYTVFTSTQSMAAAKAKARRAGYAIYGSREVPFGNWAGFVVYGKKRRRR